MPDDVWIPLGPWPTATLGLLVREGFLDAVKALDGTPHPPANPNLIDAARAKLAAHMAKH